MRWTLHAPGAPELASPARIMGIVNVTPDSFSDGGRWLDPAAAVAHGQALAAAGADWLDVGGESSRPGAEPVPEAVERERVVPVIAGLREAGLTLPISVDTRKPGVAAAAIAAGAVLVNDIGGGRDPELLALIAATGVGCCLMHMRGEPATMQDAPRYGDVVASVGEALSAAMDRALAAGVAADAIICDPGIGFGKTLEHNLALLRGLPTLQRRWGRPILVGLSRKRLLAELTGTDLPAAARDAASHLLHVQLFGHCALLRVHDVAGACLARGLWLGTEDLKGDR